MSMINAREYIRSRAKSLGLSEWKDGFDSSNLPDTILDKSFWLDMSDIASGIRRDQIDYEINFPISVRLFRKGYRTPADAIDDSIALIENLIKAVCAPAQANAQKNGIIGVTFDTSRIEPISASNNNSVVATVTFNFFVILNV